MTYFTQRVYLVFGDGESASGTEETIWFTLFLNKGSDNAAFEINKKIWRNSQEGSWG